MTYQDFFSRLYHQGIPMADIRTVLEGVFSFPFSRLGIDGNEDGIDDGKAEEVIQRLQQGYPAVYLVGYDIIRGNKIYLDQNVLIPRTETIEFIYDHVKNNYDWNNKKILDLCTGSGFIAISLKSLYPKSEVFASDISNEALKLAEKSAKENNCDIHFLKSDFLNDIQDTFDVIVSNPPYIEEDSTDVDAPFEPSLALYSGKDGMDSYRNIFQRLNGHLKENGIAFFELEAKNAEKTQALLHTIQPDSYRTEILYDMEGKSRYLKAEKKG